VRYLQTLSLVQIQCLVKMNEWIWIIGGTNWQRKTKWPTPRKTCPSSTLSSLFHLLMVHSSIKTVCSETGQFKVTSNSSSMLTDSCCACHNTHSTDPARPWSFDVLWETDICVGRQRQ